MEDADGRPAPTLQSVLGHKWIFVGGKGGVGKTTCSSRCGRRERSAFCSCVRGCHYFNGPPRRSLALQLAAVRRNVLIISTDPAHNLSDAFQQKFTSAPSPVTGVDNLFAMARPRRCGACTHVPPPACIGAHCKQVGRRAQEVDPTLETGAPDGEGGGGVLAELAGSIPGIDEAMSFAEVMRQVQTMDYDCIVFDTAPTGHTLRLLQLPTTLEKGLAKLMSLRGALGGALGQARRVPAVAAPLPPPGRGSADTAARPAAGERNAGLRPGRRAGRAARQAGRAQGAAARQFEQAGAAAAHPPPAPRGRARMGAQRVVEEVNAQFRDPELTTFVCVCIPEFLSLYETERLVQELARFEIDASAIVINQAQPAASEPAACTSCLLPAACGGAPGDGHPSACETPWVPQVIYEEEDVGQSRLLAARARMQQKYLAQFDDLYEDFHLARPRARAGRPAPGGAVRTNGGRNGVAGAQVRLPLLEEEVRGVDALRAFSHNLVQPYQPAPAGRRPDGALCALPLAGASPRSCTLRTVRTVLSWGGGGLSQVLRKKWQRCVRA